MQWQFQFAQPKQLNPADRLCDKDTGYSALQCYPLNGGCPGSAANNCYPNWIWSSLPSNTEAGEYWGFGFASGSFVDNSRAYSGAYAYTVRCVLDLCTAKCSVAGCPGSANTNCYPYIVWSDTPRDTDYYSVLWLGNGTFAASGACDSTGKCSTTYAFSVRCVLDLDFNLQ